MKSFFDTILINMVHRWSQFFDLVLPFFSFKLLSNVFSFVLNCCLFFWIFFDSFLSFCLFVSIVFSWCIVPCTLLIYDPIWLLILFRLLFKVSWFLKMFEIGFRYNLFFNIWYMRVQFFDLVLPFFQLYCFNFLYFGCNLFLIFRVVFYHMVTLWILLSRVV